MLEVREYDAVIKALVEKLDLTKWHLEATAKKCDDRAKENEQLRVEITKLKEELNRVKEIEK